MTMPIQRMIQCIAHFNTLSIQNQMELLETKTKTKQNIVFLMYTFEAVHNLCMWLATCILYACKLKEKINTYIQVWVPLARMIQAILRNWWIAREKYLWGTGAVATTTAAWAVKAKSNNFMWKPRHSICMHQHERTVCRLSMPCNCTVSSTSVG